MNNEKCATCLFGDQCRSIEDCDYYSPLEDDIAKTDRYIEDQRRAFHEQWGRYTSGRSSFFLSV